MGKILRFRRRGHIPQFEEALARLQEELTLTESFADAMVRAGNYHAAAAVIDEQRTRLTQAQATMMAAMRPRRRSNVAVAGLAAAMLIGSASFAALSSRGGDTAPSAPAVLERVEAQFDEAASSTDEQRARTIVSEALADLVSIGPEMARNPEIHEQVETFLQRQLARMRELPQSQSMIDQITAAAKKVKADIKTPPTDTPAPEPQQAPQQPSAP